jgi:hypothetical protein
MISLNGSGVLPINLSNGIRLGQYLVWFLITFSTLEPAWNFCLKKAIRVSSKKQEEYLVLNIFVHLCKNIL